jgi:hypothetical protein
MIISTAFIIVSCASDSGYPPEVEEALEAAGDNRPELEQVLRHFASGEDTLKLRAAEFLIANMEGHSYVTFMLHDSNEVEIDFDVLDYADFDELVEAADSLEVVRGEIDFSKKNEVVDLEVVESEYLIEQIDLAFKAWREKPWAGFLNFEQFCEYVLPYRGSSEPLENWRGMFLEKYADLPEKMDDSTDPVEAARLINEDILTYFGFDPRFYYHPTDQGLSEMMENGLGRCEDMTNITIYAMRANGLAVTSDYTPAWADRANNHAWNSILVPGGQVVPFMGAESSPGDYSLNAKAAKVYRKTFSQQKDNLVFQERRQDSIPRWLKGKSFVDVTAEYMPTVSPTITLTEPAPDSADIAYVCVFNDSEWRAVDWGRIEDGMITFKDLGTDVILLPALYVEGEIVPCGPPFTLSEDQPVSLFLPDTGNRTTVTISSYVAADRKSTEIANGTEYTLSYWDNGWQEIGRSVASDQPLEFKDVPSGALYWLTAEDSNRRERPFSVEGGQMVWW